MFHRIYHVYTNRAYENIYKSLVSVESNLYRNSEWYYCSLNKIFSQP